jgi:DNA-binding transcriptional LysR family regulator
MTLRHLKIFIAVVNFGSMTAAAEALYIAQPTVSQAIAELENHYGVKLFDRLSRRLYITEVGKQFLSYSRHIVTLFEEMDQIMKNPDKSGILKIGASITVGARLLPRLTNDFADTYSSIRIQAVINNTRDIGVVEGIVHSSDLISHAFMDDELVLAAGKQHPLSKCQYISSSELENLDFIVREQGSGTRELFESALAAKEIKWRLKWECNNPDGIKSAIINGIGVSFISKRLIEEEIKGERLSIIKVNGLDLKRKFSIIYHKNKYLTESMKAFFDLCYSLPSRLDF